MLSTIIKDKVFFIKNSAKSKYIQMFSTSIKITVYYIKQKGAVSCTLDYLSILP